MSFKEQKEIFEKYYREEMFPTIFCQGCGIGQVMNYTSRAIDDLNIDMKKLVLVSGIGCSSRVPAYFKANGIHTTHGRAIAFATGIKLANPELEVIVFTGDGDCMSIGGNHFIHAIRRNVDMTVIVMNNYTYGMTGGQVSPTTPEDAYTSTSQYGNIEEPIDIARLATVLNAAYVARWTTAHPIQATNSIKKGIQKKGFSVIEMLFQCPTNYGRKNNLRTALDYMKFFKEKTVLYSETLRKKSFDEYRHEMEQNIVIGEFLDTEKPTFMDNWMKLCESVNKNEERV